jgi:hypothetical protein
VRQLRVELGHDHGTIQRVADQLGYDETAIPFSRTSAGLPHDRRLRILEILRTRPAIGPNLRRARSPSECQPQNRMRERIEAGRRTVTRLAGSAIAAAIAMTSVLVVGLLRLVSSGAMSLMRSSLTVDHLPSSAELEGSGTTQA